MELSVLARVVVNIFMLSAVVNTTLHLVYREPLTGAASVGSPELHNVNPSLALTLMLITLCSFRTLYMRYLDTHVHPVPSFDSNVYF